MQIFKIMDIKIPQIGEVEMPTTGSGSGPIHYGEGAIVGKYYRSRCTCSCHKPDGPAMMHMFPCCVPDSEAINYVERLQKHLDQRDQEILKLREEVLHLDTAHESRVNQVKFLEEKIKKLEDSINSCERHPVEE